MIFGLCLIQNKRKKMMIPKYNRLSTLAWAIIFLAALWLCLVAIPQFTDRISRHEDTWARQTGDIPSVKLSEED
jgi:hypothetical protein